MSEETEVSPFRMTKEEFENPDRITADRAKFALHEFLEEEPHHGFAYRALDWQVLVVASVNLAVGDWAAYIKAIPGEGHEDEWHEVRRHGSKVNRGIAELLFPQLKEEFKYRK